MFPKSAYKFFRVKFVASAMNVKLILLLCLFCTFSQALSNYGICETKQNDGKYKKFCCDFFWQTKNGCVACNDGFESFNGSLCTPCSNNNYGKRCLKQCSCMTNQRCHHVEGCIRRSKTDSITDLGSVETWTSATPTELSSTDSQNDISRDFPIYLALGIGGIAINMVLCIMCVVSCKRKPHSNDIISNENADMGPMEDENIQEHAYDDIDENAIMGDIINQGVVINHHIKEESTSAGASVEDFPGEDYLTPYQPIVRYSNAMYKNLPLNSDTPQCPRTTDRFVEKYENTVIFNQIL